MRTPDGSYGFAVLGLARYRPSGERLHALPGPSSDGRFAARSSPPLPPIIDTPTSPVPLHLGLVILKQGNEVHTVLDTHAITTVFTKVD
jgi:hypothetical protein